MATADTVVFVGCLGDEPELAPGRGDPRAQPEPERAEDAKPAGVGDALVGEGAEAGDQPPAGHQGRPGESEQGAAQVQTSDSLMI